MKFIKSFHLSIVLALVLISFSGCEDGIFLFSIEDDKQLGMQTAAQIESDPTTYPVLDRTEHAEAYAYLQAMTDEILNSGEVKYRNEFEWRLHIIDQPVLNAFATPGGYIYVYTGLIDYLDSVDDLAGVMGHEIAHADRRHGSKQMQKQFGVTTLSQIVFGSDPNLLSQVAGQLLALKFSRSDEADADDQSVKYLGGTVYACNGAATFFERLKADGSTAGTPEFLSTHPDPKNRVADINSEAESRGCDTEQSSDMTGNMTYAEFKALFI